ncbi:SDR family oxidoreductase [Mycetocola reblochoni]|uniref:2,3-dihydro-2,3-dihydroxybenzoate dehydrogenase of siderophore biosynthesis n=1 Tax=Mycetocola reblochoni REB411 TaxID=1255698 RepID=A0A1R4IC54_9MICO|nr:SDR family oxidoreductase [Mycetocola reblochoni]SJN17415.1 2,3-dihydro-2,3-dihydroxybenzoate dehydrogenase of siderophore biosynthesis [Mycetocola reblochoni REB411]
MSADRRQAIVVTGAAGGIGSAIVSAILAGPADHGAARVYALDAHWPDDAPADTADLVRRRIDVTDEEAVASFFDELGERETLRALVNAAGVLATGPAVELDRRTLDRVLAVNVVAVIGASLAAARLMLRQGASAARHRDRSILTVASNAGTIPRAGFAAYGASKAAASQFTRSLGLELGPAGIRCTVLNPGTTRTAMVERMWGGRDRSAEAIAGDPALFRAGIPLGRVAEPEDIASVAAFLIGDGARHITAEEITVDGGATAR